MKVPGLKSCYDKTHGLFYFARMCSKIRLHADGELPEEYHDMLGQGFDGRTCRYLSVRYEEVKALVLAGKTDEEVLDRCLARGRPLTDEEVLIYNSFMSKRGWRDDETDAFIPGMIRQYGLPDDGSVITDFDLIEMDEGRWYPNMWRDAWK
jgi:gluconokinase